ncbi:J domain-containing protein [Paraburkholderia adhaesiva]|uniref:J domain-containing protein n=1 Tax=Paraburkholderia adhaesiva TaxID=2883244 RepID=UPI001F178383|nr:J domain-containing protein [Paraburkholderia adhaesiva]
MAIRDPSHHVDYDRLYYQLDLEPGASAAEITRKYRQLAQMLHPDRWRHSSPAQQHWANEQFKNMKHAREVLEHYWSEHHEAPSSRPALRREQIEALHDSLQHLQAQRERVQAEIGALRTEKTRGLDELLRMKTERDALLTELVGLRDEAAHARANSTQLRERVMASAGRRLDDAALQWRGTMGERVFALLDDSQRGWMMRLGAIVVAFLPIYAIAHKIVAVVLGPLHLTAHSHWMVSLLQWALVIGGALLVYGNGWALYAMHRAARAGQQRLVPLPADQVWHRVSTALRSQQRHGASWSFESCEISPVDSALELRAVMRFSPRAQGDATGAYRNVVTFRCRARAAGASQTALQFGFGVTAPFWWRVGAARVVSGLCKRLADGLSG